MRFARTAEQADFAAALASLLEAADATAAARAWADGDVAPGRALWQRLADLGVHGLLVPEDDGGLGASAVELVIAAEAVGRHALPGPWAESVAFLPAALPDGSPLRAALAEGAVGTVAAAPHVPWALDGDVADHVLALEGGALRTATVVATEASLDPARRLATVAAGEPVPGADPAAVARATDLAVLATAAQLLGAGERLLADSVRYVGQRRQFGREIGSYQAVKHALADVRTALEFARPLVDGAALADGAGTFSRDCSAAKVAAADASYGAARTALQVHGAIGYTREFDLSLWITKVRALVPAWGTTAHHRGRVLESLTAEARERAAAARTGVPVP